MAEQVRPSAIEFENAARGLEAVLRPTELIALDGGSEILLKPETRQVIGSFKIRGVFHAVSRLDPRIRAKGISTVSAGNTAKALAWTGRHFGVEARSLMPDGAPRTKIDSVREYGGTPVLVPTDELFRFLRERGWEAEPYAFIHPWTSRDVMIGHGSMGLEILRECPEAETVFLQVGGGGLLGGVGSALKALKPTVCIVAVEPAGCPALYRSLNAGHPVQVDCNTICDGVAVPYITDEMFPLLSDLTDRVVLVTEDEVRGSIRRLASELGIVAEGAGALATAAALKTPFHERGRSVCPITGGCIDQESLRQILAST